MIDLDDMQLPKVNKRKQQSNSIQKCLKNEITRVIKEMENRSGYKFESYEVDNVLLEMVKQNQEAYLNQKFGYE